MFGFLGFTRLQDYILATGVSLEAFLKHQYEMTVDQLKEVAPEVDWKEKLALLDQHLGWDDDHVSAWSDICDEDDQQVYKKNRPLPSDYDDQNHSDTSQSAGSVNETAVEDLEDAFHDEEAEIWETEDEEDDYDSKEDDMPPMHPVLQYLYHRFGPRLRWEDRCECCEFLIDPREERRRLDRVYYARKGTPMAKCPCVLLSHRQADLPGTENVDKPVLMVTTPEGDQVYPHDLKEYPDVPADSRGGRPLVSQREYAVPYEEEDTPDF